MPFQQNSASKKGLILLLMKRKLLLAALFAAPITLGSIASIPNVAKAGCGCWPYSTGWSPVTLGISMIINAAEGDKCAVNPAASKASQRHYCESCGWDYYNTGFFSTQRNYCKV